MWKIGEGWLPDWTRIMIRITGNGSGTVRLHLLAACLAVLPGAALASPPPPPPRYIDNAAVALSADLTPQSFDAYAAIFADDLHVFVDERLLASDKTSWLALE